jgi:hypothetical protein
MKNLLLSGRTATTSEWDILDVIGISKTREQQSLEIQQYNWDNKIGPQCDGMTYLEIEQFNNTYNNFR